MTSLTYLDIRADRIDSFATLNVGLAVSRMHLLQEIWLMGMLSYIPSQFSDLPYLRWMSIADLDELNDGEEWEAWPFFQAGALENCPSLTWLSLWGVLPCTPQRTAAQEW